MKVICIILISMLISGCKDAQDKVVTNQADDALSQKRSDSNKPRALTIEFIDSPQLTAYGFVMEASWSENHQSTTMYASYGDDQKTLSDKDKDLVYKHLESFFDLPKIDDFLDKTDSSVRQKNGKYNVRVFDSHVFDYKVYSLPKEHVDFKRWLSKFHELHDKLCGDQATSSNY